MRAGCVLVVDDEENNRTLLRDTLERRNYEVVEAEDGAAALAFIKKRSPDVILLDLMMPGMDGFVVCREIKRNPATAAIPVLMVTALSERKERLMGIEAGANDFLSKPVDLQDVILRVGNAVQTKKLYDQLQVEQEKSERLLLNILPERIAQRMKAGDVSDPIPSPSGFHLVRLDETRGASRIVVTQRHVRHILISPNEVLSESLAFEKIVALRQRIVAGEDFATIAREESDDHASATNGGDLGWSAPDSYAGTFEDALKTLQPGELSSPVHTEFGWHLIELLETREHDDTDEQRRNIAYQELRKQKAEVETDHWERQLRDEAYVEIRL